MTRGYPTICYYSRQDEAYLIFAPDLPGCWSDGKTVEDAKKNLSVIIDEWIECARQSGQDVPDPLSKLSSTSPSVFDIAKYVLSETGAISTMMLQKLVYYCQAWALGWFHQPLFPQRFEAWQKGPVCRELFYSHQGKRIISKADIESDHLLSCSEKKLIDNVLTVYKGEDPDWLSELTHSEQPWIQARGTLSDDRKSNEIIDVSSIETFYQSLV